MASATLSITTMNGGGIVEAIDEVLSQIADNIADVNTPPDKVREVNVKIKIKPDKNRVLGTADIIVSAKLQPQEPQVVSIVFDKKDGKPAIFESFADQRPDQHTFSGTTKPEMPTNVTPFRAAK